MSEIEIEVVGHSIKKPNENEGYWSSFKKWIGKTSNQVPETQNPIEIEVESTESWYSFTNIKEKLKNINLFSPQQQEPQSVIEQFENSISSYITLTYLQRIYGFLFTFAMGCLCFFIAIMFLSTIVLTGRLFALFYTLGNIFIFTR